MLTWGNYFDRRCGSVEIDGREKRRVKGTPKLQ